MSFQEAALKLGNREPMVGLWKTKWDIFGDNAFPGNGKLTVRNAEMAKLVEEVCRFRMEQDI